MKRKLSVFLLTVLLIPVFCLQVSANQKIYVVDQAQLLTDGEEAGLIETIDFYRQYYDMDIVILTLDSLDGQRPQDYADNYYDANSFADDGILFLLSMQERDWYISTCGEAIYAFTDYGIQQLGESCVNYLSQGDYYRAFQVFLEELPIYLDSYRAGAPIDGNADYSGDYYHGDREEVIYYDEPYSPSLFLSVLIGLGAALITVGVMRSSMNTKRRQYSASVYLKDNSYHLSEHQDMFLYSNVSKARKPQNNNSGGSSVHRGGGGRSHGGGGGKF